MVFPKVDNSLKVKIAHTKHLFGTKPCETIHLTPYFFNYMYFNNFRVLSYVLYIMFL